MPLFQLPAGIRTYTIASPGVTIYYPAVYGLANPQAEERINRAISQLVHAMRQEQLKMQTGTDMQMTGHYEIKTNERGLLSLILTNYAYSRPMAHGFTVARSLTFDTNTGRLYRLQDLFKPGANYAAVLTALVTEQARRRKIPLLNGSPQVHPNQDYYLADKSLVIYYPLYAIAPYYVGFPMFPISVYELQDIAAEGGPLDRLTADVS